jgi:hypothetical protein
MITGFHFESPYLRVTVAKALTGPMFWMEAS